MKITDLRVSRVFEGEHVATVAGGSMPSEEHVEVFGVFPERSTHKRIVLKIGERFTVFPVNKKFFKVEP
jgi:hypothetical protein